MPQSAGASGGKKKKKGRAPAHQNKYAFRHNPKSKKTDKILTSPNVGVCRRCHEKIEWRKQYRKYKPLTQPGKCNLCQRRNIKAAYHTICADCAVGDRANKAVLEATTGTSAAASGKTEAKPETATESTSNNDQQVAVDEAVAVENTSDHGSDDEEEETPETPRNRRVCEICVKDYALGSLEDDEEGDELAQLEAALEGKLKLREKRAIERKIERLVEERRRNRRKAKQQEQEEEDDEDESGEEDGSNATENEKNNDDVQEKVAAQEDAKADANDDNSGDEVDEEEDPFLKAVGGADKLLTGEAYQKALLEKAG